MAYVFQKEIAQNIVEAVKEVCGRDVNFITTEGVIQASTDHKRIGDFHEIGRRVAKSGSQIEVTEQDNYWGTQPGVNIPVIYQKQTAGVIGITGDPEEVRRYAYLAQRMALMILQEQDQQLRSFSRRNEDNYIIRSLMIHRPVASEYLQEFMEAYDLSQSKRYFAVRIRIHHRYNMANLPLIEKEIEDAVIKKEKALMGFHYPNEYELILPEAYQKRWMQSLQQLSERYGTILNIGVGSGEKLEQLHHSYKAAGMALNVLEEDRHLASYEDMDLALLLGNVAEEVQNQYRQKTVSNLSESDLALLKAYFRHDRSLKETAEALFIHKNTLQYRLDKIHEKCGYDPRSFRDAVVLYLAVRL